MKLKAVRLQNFRCYREEVVIPIDDLTAFVGKNDVGKSAILEALDIFFEGGVIGIEPGDASVDGDATKVRIGCVFTEFPIELVLDVDAKTDLASERLLNEDGDLELLKVYNCSTQKCASAVFARALHPSVPPYAGLLQAKNAELKKLIKERRLEAKCNLADNPSMRHAFYESADDLQLQMQEIRIDDREAKAIWESLKRYLPVYGLFQADRPSKVEDDEVQDPMKLAIKRALSEVGPELERVKDRVQARALDLAQATVVKLSESHPEIATDLKPRFKAEPGWATLFKLDLDDHRGIPMNKRGSGVRRLILLNFFRAEVERKRKETDEFGGSARSMIFAIEEPETSQHPGNQQAILETLRELAASGDQVILTTHVPALAGMLPLESIRFIDTPNAEMQPRVRRGNETTFQEIADSLGVLPTPLGKEVEKLRVALSVEGPSDEQALAAFSDILYRAGKISFTLRGPCPEVFIAICGGSTLRHWVNRGHLDKLGLPQVHIYDSDREHAGHDGKKATRELLGRLNSVRSRCFLTRKRNMDNYLHPAVVERITGGKVVLQFENNDAQDYVRMEEVVVTQLIEPLQKDTLGVQVNARTLDGSPIALRKGKSKEWISSFLLPQMTVEEVLERSRYVDEEGSERFEVLEWFIAIQSYLSGRSA